MRKITANYIFPISTAPLKNGIIVLDDSNRILEIIDTKNNFKEIENLEFYGGVIVPGFVDAFTLLSYSSFTLEDFKECLIGDFNSNLKSIISSLKPDLKSVQRGINHLEAFGTKAAADLFPYQDSQPIKKKSKVHFSNFDYSSNYQVEGKSDSSSNTISLINQYIIENGGFEPSSLEDLCIGTGSLGTHQKLSVFEEMKAIQKRFPEFSIWEIIKWASLNPAKKLQIESDFGSLEVGKKPGLNIISAIDFQNNQLTAKSELKVLI